MTRTDIIWLVEHVDRELDAACIAKVLLAERYGLSVEIFHLYLDVERAARRRDAAVIVFPYFYQRIPDYHDAFLHHQIENSTVFCMAWEQIYYKTQEAIKAPRDDFAKKRVEYIAWGDFFCDYLTSHGTDPARVEVTGHPALQLYLPPYCNFFPDRVKLAERFGLDPDKPWVVIPENYRWAFRTRTSTIKAGKGSVEVEKLLEMRQFCIDSLEQLASWCQAAAATGQVELILRPRPSTSVARMNDFIRAIVPHRHDSFHVIKDFSAREWILAADLVISSVSTTLIEAAVAGKPVAIAEPLPIVDSLAADWQNLVPRIRDQDSFVAFCKSPNLAGRSTELNAWSRARYLAAGDAYDNLVARLASLVQRQYGSLPTRRDPDKMLATSPFVNAYWRAIRQLRRDPRFHPARENIRRLRDKLLGRPHHKISFVFSNQEKDIFTPAEIEARTARWRTVLANPPTRRSSFFGELPTYDSSTP